MIHIIVIHRYIHCKHNTIRQLHPTRVISIDLYEKVNIADLLIKGLNRELAEKSSRGMKLKCIK